MKLSLDPPTGPFHLPDEARLADGIEASRASPRRRIVIPVQRSETDPVQRLLNVVQPGSYIRPHLHPRPQGTETVCVLAGALAVFFFSDEGEVAARFTLRPGAVGGLIDIVPRVWHGFAALEPDTIALEIKGGPYDRELDKVWPAWAPPEGDPAAADALARWLAASP